MSKSFKSFLAENAGFSDVETLKAFLKANCMDACKLMSSSGNYMFRGMLASAFPSKIQLTDNSLSVTRVVIEDVRKDRKPRDTPADIHEILNTWFKKKFNWPARSAGLFVTPKLDDAFFFGAPCIIFPVGEVKGLFSKRVDDLTTYIFTNDFDVESPSTNIPGGPDYWHNKGYEKLEHVPAPEIEDYVINRLEDADYHYGPITEEMLQRVNEIMLDCDKYVAIAIAHKGKVLKEHIKEIIDEVANDRG